MTNFIDAKGKACPIPVVLARQAITAGADALTIENLPRSILFMNDGVKLPVGDSQVVEHLNALQGKGVEVLVCGTCLNFYGLTEQLQTGTVSNMFDIVSAMQAAGKVITL